MIHQIWFIMMAGSIIYGGVTGNVFRTIQASLEGSGRAIALTMELGGGYMFFCGLMEIMKAAGAEKGLLRVMAPLQRRLMPHIQSMETRRAVLLNLVMNVLGMGNAATPAGLDAMRMMEAERQSCASVRHDMEMFLILNATSLQLIPTTVLTLRMASGSANPNAVLVPTILCTAFSTVVGVACGLLCRWRKK